MAVWAPAPVGAHTEPGGRDKGRVKGAPPNSSESGKGEHRTTAGNSFLSESSLLEESLFFFFSTLNNYILSAVLKLKRVSVALYNFKASRGYVASSRERTHG